MIGSRIVIVGSSGSGKSTLGKALAKSRGFSFVELDALHWDPGWEAASAEEFLKRVDIATSGAAWVAAGNYSGVRPLLWSRADTLIWLDLPFPLVLWRTLARTVRRAISQEELWNGNRESWRMSFFSRESVLVWLFQTFWRRRREFAELVQAPAFAHLKVIRVRNRGAAVSLL